MKSPKISISWGELFDKITILEIKLENLHKKSALKNVKLEHDQLCKIYDSNFLEHENARRLMHDLKKINQKLWDIEDKIRDKERSKNFDVDFIELARKVYFTNDERSCIKRNINEIFGSELFEEKSYAHY
ncbi:MAG: DUF6165 family protein [Candidatus Puniceispirillales bacterium]|tara:strand:+ start:94 stop:483 length:390 start_codon:yes stop_codon:yes gene_type:complete